MRFLLVALFAVFLCAGCGGPDAAGPSPNQTVAQVPEGDEPSSGQVGAATEEPSPPVEEPPEPEGPYEFDFSQLTIGRVPEDTLGMPIEITIELPEAPEAIQGPSPEIVEE